MTDMEKRLAEALRETREALVRAEGELVYMKEKMPHTNAADALHTLRKAKATARTVLDEHDVQGEEEQ